MRERFYVGEIHLGTASVRNVAKVMKYVSCNIEAGGLVCLKQVTYLLTAVMIVNMEVNVLEQGILVWMVKIFIIAGVVLPGMVRVLRGRVLSVSVLSKERSPDSYNGP